jgi:hypothetical protein
MGLGYGQTGYRVSSAQVSSVNLTSCSLNSYKTKPDMFGQWTCTMNNVSCSSTGFNIIIDDSKIPFVWTHIAWKTRIEFRSSCWDFAENNSGYGNGTHNIMPWDPSQGDVISKPLNCFELSQYAVKMFTCDNNSDNFVHQSHATGSFREWRMKRRRNGTNPAGPAAGFACTSGGTCIISDIVVWREE